MRKLFNGFVSFLLAISFVFSSEAGRPYGITRTAHAPMSVAGALSWGGVLFAGTAEVWVDDKGVLTRAASIEAIEFDPEQNVLCVKINERCYNTKITEDRLSRLASFVENGGVGAYTYYKPDEQTAIDQALEECKFLEDGWCVPEVLGDEEFERAVYALDFAMVRPIDLDRERRITSRLNEGKPETGARYHCHYEVSDIYPSRTIAKLGPDATIYLSGRLHRFYREIVDPDGVGVGIGRGGVCGQISPSEKTRLIASASVLATGIDELILLSELQAGERGHPCPEEAQQAKPQKIDLNALECRFEAASADRSDEAIRYQGIGLRIARQIALLRGLKRDHPEAWRRFRDTFFQT